MLMPHWGKLATKMKHMVKVAYWDTETGIRPPAALGEIRGTPTMKIFVPKRKSRKNKKQAIDYNGPRELKDMRKFAEHYMPNFVEPVNGQTSHDKLLGKGEKHGLPVALLFSKSKKGTTPLIKALSAEYRRRILIGEVRGSTANKALIDKYGVQSMPHLIVVKPGEDGEEGLAAFDGKPTYNRLNSFFGKHALKKAVKKAKKQEKKTAADEEEEEAAQESGAKRKRRGSREEL